MQVRSKNAEPPKRLRPLEDDSDDQPAAKRLRLTERKSTPYNGATLMTVLDEIREQIFRLLIGDRNVHITRDGAHLTHYTCHKPDDHPDRYARVTTEQQYAYDAQHKHCDLWPHPGESEHAIDLSLLRVCRQMYHYARLLPYKTNNFIFDYNDVFMEFGSRSSQQQREATRSVVVCLDGVRDEEYMWPMDGVTPLPCLTPAPYFAMGQMPNLTDVVYHVGEHSPIRNQEWIMRTGAIDHRPGLLKLKRAAVRKAVDRRLNEPDWKFKARIQNELEDGLGVETYFLRPARDAAEEERKEAKIGKLQGSQVQDPGSS